MRNNMFFGPKKKIAFEENFDPAIKKRILDFLASDKAAANFTKGVLIAVALGGVFIAGAAAPNLFQALKLVNTHSKKRLNQNGFERLRRSFYELRRRRYIEQTPSKSRPLWRLTVPGILAINTYLDTHPFLPRPRRWDEKWHLVFFDIPNTHRRQRDTFRRYLKELGCCQVQKSVWAHPFSCHEQVYNIARRLGITCYVDIYTVEDFDNPNTLAHFRKLLSYYSRP